MITKFELYEDHREDMDAKGVFLNKVAEVFAQFIKDTLGYCTKSLKSPQYSIGTNGVAGEINAKYRFSEKEDEIGKDLVLRLAYRDAENYNKLANRKEYDEDCILCNFIPTTDDADQFICDLKGYLDTIGIKSPLDSDKHYTLTISKDIPKLYTISAKNFFAYKKGSQFDL